MLDVFRARAGPGFRASPYTLRSFIVGRQGLQGGPVLRGVDLLAPLLILLAVLSSAGCLLGLLAALKRQRRRAHLANAAVLGLCTAGSAFALAINPDSGAHGPGVLLLLVMAGVTLACLGAARRDAGWAGFWAAWLLSAAAAASLLYLWLGFRIF